MSVDRAAATALAERIHSSLVDAMLTWGEAVNRTALWVETPRPHARESRKDRGDDERGTGEEVLARLVQR